MRDGLSEWMRDAGVAAMSLEENTAEKLAPVLEEGFLAFFRAGLPLEEWRALTVLERTAAVRARRRHVSEILALVADVLANPKSAAERHAGVALGAAGRAAVRQANAEQNALAEVLGTDPARVGGAVAPAPEAKP